MTRARASTAANQWRSLVFVLLLFVCIESCIAECCDVCSSGSGTGSGTGNGTDSDNGKFVVCYYGTWATYRPGDGKFDIEDIDTSLCTHLMYAFAVMNAGTFEIESHDTWNDIDLKGFERFTNLKTSNSNLKTLLSVGGWTDSHDGTDKYIHMVADPIKRATFIQSAVDILTKYNFDGLDVDWEYPTDKADFAVLIQELRAEFDDHDFLLSIAMSASRSTIESAYDFTVLCEHLDFINLMTYDFYGSWNTETGHHTDIRKLREATNVIIKNGGCIDKIVLGMALYGRTFKLTDPSNHGIGAPSSGAGNPGPYTAESGYIGYNELCEQEYDDSDYIKTYDSTVIGAYMYSGDQWIGYDERTSIRTKSVFAMKKGYLGGMVWSIETDDFKGKCGNGKFPLLKIINKKIRN